MEEIKQGYKQTDIGVIPEDWEVGKLEELITVLTDFTANGSFASLAENVTYLETPSYARLVRLTDIRANFKNAGVYLSKDSYDFLKKSKLFGDELLLANVGAYAGYSFLYPSGLDFTGTLGPNMFLIKFDDKALNYRYVYYCFTNGIIFHQLLSKAASSAQPKLNKQNVRECDIIYPANLTEQTAIATALSDTDALIAALDKKIAKKQQIKQGAMQQLLTGKKRLPGFSGEWVEKELKKISSMNSGGTPNSNNPNYYNGDIPFLSISDISKSGKYIKTTDKHITKLGLENSSARLFPAKTIMYAMYASVGKCSIANIEISCSQAILGITVNEYTNSEFLYYYLSFIQSDILSFTQTGTQSNLSKRIVEKFVVNIPNNKAEQTAIAQILTDMDNEIAQLEKERDKYKEIKAGMMQVLLTGRVRVV
jgi:type I restriction enzyme S subunit